MQLSERLQAIASMVTTGSVLVDVGCDHGYLPVWVIREGICPRALATDLRPGPLDRAREHVISFGLENRIELRLSDGLDAVRPGEGDTLVIAGMGGPLMERILTRGWETAVSFQELILQPQSDLPHFRRFLGRNGWNMVDEELVLDGGKYYFIIKIVPRRGKQSRDPGLPELFDEPEQPYSAEEIFGPCLLEKTHPLLRPWLQKEEKTQLEILESLKESVSPKAAVRAQEVSRMLALIREAVF